MMDNGQTLSGRGFSGDNSEEALHQMILDQEAQQMLNQSSGAMTAANQQDFIHQFQHQSHGYAFNQGYNQNSQPPAKKVRGSSGMPSSQQLQQYTQQQQLKQEGVEYKQSSVPAAARVRPRSQTGNQSQGKTSGMMMF